ncbi:hypothetical protein EBU99_09465 [bacterium]|nr:hypothetical protein [bacterium]
MIPFQSNAVRIFLAVSTVFFFAGCGHESSSTVMDGRYQLMSAHLNQNGRYREVECQGNFEISISRSRKIVRIQPSGSSVCRSPNPASFEEAWGGTCNLNPVSLVEAGQEETFKQVNVSLNCGQEGSSTLSIFSLQALSDKGLQLTHSTPGVDTASEFIFTRVSQ